MQDVSEYMLGEGGAWLTSLTNWAVADDEKRTHYSIACLTATLRHAVGTYGGV